MGSSSAVWWGRSGGEKDKGERERKKRKKGEEQNDSLIGGSHLQFSFGYSKYK
jgi:hypothetical protein